MKTPRTIALLSVALGTALALAGCNTTSEVEVDKARISPEKARELLTRHPERYLLVDARPESAYRSERIPHSVRLDPRDVDPRDPDPKFNAYKAVIVYGDDPSYGRANGMTKRFLESGIKVNMIDGGLKAWREKGYPVEAGE